MMKMEWIGSIQNNVSADLGNLEVDHVYWFASLEREGSSDSALHPVRFYVGGL
jgi:hypothetical protein